MTVVWAESSIVRGAQCNRDFLKINYSLNIILINKLLAA
jgi:hypothetical protein